MIKGGRNGGREERRKEGHKEGGRRTPGRGRGMVEGKEKERARIEERAREGDRRKGLHHILEKGQKILAISSYFTCIHQLHSTHSPRETDFQAPATLEGSDQSTGRNCRS